MDLGSKRFGKGPRELGGSVDLINQYKLWAHYDYFCKKSRPSSISKTRYLHNVVGETEIRKGEGMELDQLLQNTSAVRERPAQVHPFDLDILREAFQMRETNAADLPCGVIGIPTTLLKLNCESKDENNHKKHRRSDKKEYKDQKSKRRHKDGSRDEDGKKTRNGHHDFGFEHLHNQKDKKRRYDGIEYISNNQWLHKSEQKKAKICETGTLRIVR